MVSTRSKRSRHDDDQEERRRERQKWEVIYNSLKQLISKQQSQLHSLLQERHFLLQRLDIQQHSSHSIALLLRQYISQLRRQLELSKLSNMVGIAKADFLSATNKRDASFFKSKLEDTRHELDDFKSWFDILSHRCPDQEDIAPDWLYEILRAKGGKDSSPETASEQNCKMLEMEVATLKREYEKLSVNNSSEVASLRSEIKFAWNQYNEKECNFTKQLQAKNDEVSKANEKIMVLLDRLEQLQSSNSDKDQIVSALRANISRLEDEARQKDETITNFSKELELLKSKRLIGISTLKRCSAEPSPSISKRTRSSRDKASPNMEEEGSSSAQIDASNASLRSQLNKLEAEANLKNGEIARLSKELNLLKSKTIGNGNMPVVSRCTGEPSSSRSRIQGNGNSKGFVVPKEDASSAQPVSEKGGKRSKRNQADVISLENTPKLFTSQFRIPKLRSQSPGWR